MTKILTYSPPLSLLLTPHFCLIHRVIHLEGLLNTVTDLLVFIPLLGLLLILKARRCLSPPPPILKLLATLFSQFLFPQAPS